MQNVTRNIKLNMQKTMIIICRQCVKTNTFSLCFHVLFSPFFVQDTSKSGFGDGQKWGWTPPPHKMNDLKTTSVLQKLYKVQPERAR